MMILVSCVSMHASKPKPGAELYISPWFQLARKYAETRGDWLILSAKHGLVTPTTVLAPYDVRLSAQPKAYRVEWAARVIAAWDKAGIGAQHIEILAGKAYRENLIEPLVARGCTVVVPMEGLAIGKQLQWLKNSLRNPSLFDTV
jgi:hypothetical protein